MSALFERLLARSQPLDSLSEAERSRLLQHAVHLNIASGQTILRKTDGDRHMTWLVVGRVEVRRSFFERETHDAGTDATIQPLESWLSEASQLIAGDDCEVVQLEREAVEKALSQVGGAGRGYSVETLHETDLSEEYLISDAQVDVDWMSRFLQSGLTQHLPASVIQKLLARFEQIEIQRGDRVLRRGSQADGLYVLVRGMAVVHTDPDGPFKGDDIELIPGDYCGEEALVAETLRNASVSMESDGIVARLSLQDFDALIRPHLVRVASVVDAREWINKGGELFDVRTGLEARAQPLPGARQLPVTHLRSQLGNLDRNSHYLVGPEGDRRAELAVFLLCQAGLAAHIMPNAALAEVA